MTFDTTRHTTSGARPSIAVLVVHDHPGFRQALGTMIEQEPDMHVGGLAATVAEAGHQLAAIDVAVADLDLAMSDGNRLITQLAAVNPQGMVLVATASRDQHAIAAAIDAGAAAVIEKSTPITEIIDAIRRAAAGERARRETGHRTRRVLVLEDDEDIQDLLCDVLGLAGLEVMGIGHPDLILHAARAFLPDLFLIDIMLPGESGIEVAERLQRLGFAGTPMIAISASTVMRDAAITSGRFFAALGKPFDIEALLACTDTAMTEAAGAPGAGGAGGSRERTA